MMAEVRISQLFFKAYACVAKHIGLPLMVSELLYKVTVGLKHSKPWIRVQLCFSGA